MKATEELIYALMAVAYGNKDLKSQRARLNNLCIEADKEILELEAKVAELDRREQGVDVTEFNEPCWYIGCSRCESVATGTYCSVCGTKLIWLAKWED